MHVHDLFAAANNIIYVTVFFFFFFVLIQRLDLPSLRMSIVRPSRIQGTSTTGAVTPYQIYPCVI